MTGPRLTPLAASLPASVPFVGPEAQERARNVSFAARLGANESQFGPSPRALAAMRDAAQEIWKYGDPENHALRQALARRYGVAPESIVIGEGIDALLGYAVRLFAGPGDKVVTSAGAYPTFNYHVRGHGAELVEIPYREDREDLPGLVRRAADTGARLVYFANPDNPMGSWHSAAEIDRALDDLPRDCLLLLDEAYVEFAPDGAVPPLEPGRTNVLRLRTFSKAHGMAGARVGYGIGHPDVIAAFDRVRNHFGVNRIAQAGALAALEDDAHLARVLALTAAARDRIAGIARQNGLTPLPSATNFVTLDCGHDGDFARAVLNGLVARGIFVRMPFVAPQDRCIRVSAGPEDALDLLAEALPQALADARSQMRK